MSLKPFNCAILLYGVHLVTRHLRLVIMVLPNACTPVPGYLEHNITNIILVDVSESLNGSRAEAYANGDISLDVICLIFA